MTSGIAPLPALVTYFAPLALTHTDLKLPEDRWDQRMDAPQLIGVPRVLNALLVGVPLVIAIFWWLWRRRGLAAATLGGGIAALSPTLVAHGGLATTDAGAAFFGTVAIAAIAWFATAPGAARLLVCALAVAAAMAAKYSLVFLLPVASLVFLWSSIQRHGERRGLARVRPVLREFIVHSMALVFLVLPLWWALHLFARIPPQDLDAPADRYASAPFAPGNFLQLANTLAPVIGLRYQLEHVRSGGDAYLAGERSTEGFWYYFPAAFLIKSTPSELALAALLVIAVGVAVRHPVRSLIQLDSTWQCLLLSAAILSWALLHSHLNLGHRYMILMYPMLFIGAADWLASRLNHRPRQFAAVVGLLLVLQAASSLSIAPHDLAYVNQFAGGPGNGWRLLADSSLDWGQDLPALRAFLERHRDDRAAMKYFGSVLPAAYGVRVDEVENLQAPPEAYTLLALSATYLNGLYMNGLDPFKAFRTIEPDAQAGYSILLYDLRRPEALSAFREALAIFRR